jgi:hypothetical protein
MHDRTLYGTGTFIVDVDRRQAEVEVLLTEAALLRTHAVHKLFQRSQDIPPHPINLPVRSSKKRSVCMQSFRKPYRCSYLRCRYSPVLRIRIRRIRMFLGLLDPDPFVRGTDLAPDRAADPSIIKKK